MLGYGAIGSRVAHALHAGGIPGAELVGVVARTATPARSDGISTLDLKSAVRQSDLIVEAAGVTAVRELGHAIISGGSDLLLSSIGALADEELRTKLFSMGPGRCFLSTGAIGGLDLLAVAARDGGLTHATLTSRKRAHTLVQPWMSQAEREALTHATSSIPLFTGNVEEAIARFPASLNVGVALAAATGLWRETRIELIADPDAELTTHEIHAAGPSGNYEFRITNEPLPRRPTSSALVSQALLSGVARLIDPSGRFI